VRADVISHATIPAGSSAGAIPPAGARRHDSRRAHHPSLRSVWCALVSSVARRPLRGRQWERFHPRPHLLTSQFTTTCVWFSASSLQRGGGPVSVRFATGLQRGEWRGPHRRGHGATSAEGRTKKRPPIAKRQEAGICERQRA
jgi:hypothetical protein